MAQESERAGGASVSARLEDADEIADFGFGKFGIARENI
jgi:hypothetical protein